MTIDSPDTVLDLWRKFDQRRLSPPVLHGRRNRYEPLALATPAMVWQIALLSRKPALVAAVRPAVSEMLQRVDFSKIDLGWAYNYAVLAALWSVTQAESQPAPAKASVPATARPVRTNILLVLTADTY